MKIKHLSFTLFILLFACTDKSKNDNVKSQDTSKSEEETVKQALLDVYNSINDVDLTDSLNFNKLKSLFDDSFVELPDKGQPLSNKETIWEGYRGFFKSNKGHFDVTIDRIEVSAGLAYALDHYHEVFTKIGTGEKVVDVMHSAIIVFRKDSQGKWKIVAWKYT